VLSVLDSLLLSVFHVVPKLQQCDKKFIPIFVLTDVCLQCDVNPGKMGTGEGMHVI